MLQGKYPILVRSRETMAKMSLHECRLEAYGRLHPQAIRPATTYPRFPLEYVNLYYNQYIRFALVQNGFLLESSTLVVDGIVEQKLSVLEVWCE